jgi:hypothetical protein
VRRAVGLQPRFRNLVINLGLTEGAVGAVGTVGTLERWNVESQAGGTKMSKMTRAKLGSLVMLSFKSFSYSFRSETTNE